MIDTVVANPKESKGLTCGTNPRKLGKTLAKHPPVDYSMQGSVGLG